MAVAGASFTGHLLRPSSSTFLEATRARLCWAPTWPLSHLAPPPSPEPVASNVIVSDALSLVLFQTCLDLRGPFSVPVTAPGTLVRILVYILLVDPFVLLGLAQAVRRQPARPPGRCVFL